MNVNGSDRLPRHADLGDAADASEPDADRHSLATLMRSLRGVPSRREVLRGLAAAGLGLGLARLPLSVAAEPKRRKKRKKPTPPKPNRYGCLEFGDRCRRSTQCCSGICAGQPGHKRCRAHNTGGCTAQFDGCGGLAIGCGTGGYCVRTTGKASFCGGPGGACVDCRRDADCQAAHGLGAACVVCDDCIGKGSNGTACYPAGA